MSASETNLQEGASSFGIALQTKPHHRTKEEEIIFVRNQIRFKTKTVLETLKQIKEKKFDRENQTIYFEELDKKVVNISEIAFDKLIAYVETITENNQILPDLSHSHALNHHFSRAFGQQFTGQRNAFRENPELVNRLVSFFPSGSYESIYIPDCSLDSNIYLLIIFTLIEEYLFLNSDSASSKKEERQITPTFDTFGDELPLQQISFLNPTFNSVIVHISEQKESIVGASVYILMLSDVMENIEQLSPLVQNSLGFDFSEPSNAKKKTMKKMQTTGDLRRPMTTELKSTRIVNPPKYDHVSHTSQIPDFTRDIVRSFIRKIDSNNDDKIDAYDLIKFCKIKNLVLEDKVNFAGFQLFSKDDDVRLCMNLSIR